ncbi:sugar phosphate isomerase/epimerase [bacterium]|nr:sugar phosphate isomerase/epimerase [bacterium]
MIYISSSCIKSNTIEDSIRVLADEGFVNIELSGGTDFKEGTLEELGKLKKEYQLNYLLHNYFPPPSVPFVLNLASLDDEISRLTMQHLKMAIDWSVALNAKKYAFHAGFLINIPLDQIGKEIKKMNLFDSELAYNCFNTNISEIYEYAQGKVELYIENNVLNKKNYTEFGNVDPFFFTSSLNVDKIKWKNEYKTLLDVAHLKVSCNSLSLNFDQELSYLFDKTDYIHISDNDGLSDSNQGLKEDSDLFYSLSNVWKSGKTCTIEVYSGMNDIKMTFDLLQQLNKI